MRTASGGEPKGMYLHIQAEEKVESAKEEVEVWMHMRIR